MGNRINFSKFSRTNSTTLIHITRYKIMRNFADRIISYYILTHITILYYYNKPPSALRGLIWKSAGHELMLVLIHGAKSWAPCENVVNLANEIAVARGGSGRDEIGSR